MTTLTTDDAIIAVLFTIASVGVVGWSLIFMECVRIMCRSWRRIVRRWMADQALWLENDDGSYTVIPTWRAEAPTLLDVDAGAVTMRGTDPAFENFIDNGNRPA